MSALLESLASVYGFAGATRAAAYRTNWLPTRRLFCPVISVGNLTMGGTGKTPLVELIAHVLLSRGVTPSILTRGYRRKRGPSLIALEPGVRRAPDPRMVGDEAALLAAALPEAPMVICADRYRGGIAVEERFRVGAHILDDGFQHLALARDANLVALDATQPLSDRSIAPAGRQRERSAALRRATAVVITRAGQADSTQLEEQVQRIRPGVPVFHSRTKLTGWREVAGGRLQPANALAGKHVLAFCAIGNPRSFFRDLARWGCEVVGGHVFPDHYRYTSSDVAHLVLSARTAGGAALVTTMKDVMNLPDEWRSDLNAYASVIEAEVLEAQEFEDWVLGLPGLRLDRGV